MLLIMQVGVWRDVEVVVVGNVVRELFAKALVWGDCDIHDSCLSSIGYVFLVNGGAISWRSTKRHCRCLTQPRPKSQVSAQQHRNSSFFAN
jgi:hypothetical protein